MLLNETKFWFKKYSVYIAIFLMIILLFKSCNSCSAERRYEYILANTIDSYTYNIDSMQNVIDDYKNTCGKLQDSLSVLKHENNLLESIIEEVRQDKEYYKNQNRNLTNVAKNLSVRKDTIK
jgi:cell shape-determining protein MreC